MESPPHFRPPLPMAGGGRLRSEGGSGYYTYPQTGFSKSPGISQPLLVLYHMESIRERSGLDGIQRAEG